MSAAVVVSEDAHKTPFTQHAIKASTSIRGSLIKAFTRTEQRALKTGVAVAHVHIIVALKRPICILVSKFSNIFTVIYKAENIAVASEPHEFITHLIIGDLWQDTDASRDVNIISM